MSDDSYFVAYTTELPLGDPVSRIIQSTPPTIQSGQLRDYRNGKNYTIRRLLTKRQNEVWNRPDT